MKQPWTSHVLSPTLPSTNQRMDLRQASQIAGIMHTDDRWTRRLTLINKEGKRKAGSFHQTKAMPLDSSANNRTKMVGIRIACRLMIMMTAIPATVDAQGFCGPSSLNADGDLQIAESCASTVSAEFTTIGEVLAFTHGVIWISNGTIAPDSCKIYAGNDASGDLVATIGGNGDLTWAPVVARNNFISCDLTRTRSTIVTLSARQVSDGCLKGVSAPFPYTVIMPSEASFPAYCEYEILAEDQDLNITFTSGMLSEGTFVFIWIENDSSVMFTGPSDITSQTVTIPAATVGFLFFFTTSLPYNRMVFVAGQVPQDAEGSCGPTSFNTDGDLTIAATCTGVVSASYWFISPNPMESGYLWISSGSLGPDSCNNFLVPGPPSDETIGGLAPIWTQGAASNNFVNCTLTETRPETVTLSIAQVPQPDCFFLAYGPYPQNFSTPNDPDARAYCSYGIVNAPEDLEIVFTSGLLSQGSFVFFVTNEGGTAPLSFSGPSDITSRKLPVSRNHVALLSFVAHSTPHQVMSFTVRETLEVETPEKTCEPSGVNIPLSDDDLNSLHAASGDVFYISPNHVTNLDELPPECRSTFEDPTFSFNLTACPSRTNESNPEVLMFTFTIWNRKMLDLSAVVQRFVRYSLDFTCKFNATTVVSSGKILPRIDKVMVALDPVSGEFDITLQLFDNDGFFPALPPDAMMTVPENLFGKVALNGLPEGEEAFIIQVESCLATNVPESDAEPMYPIITGGCASVSGGESSDTREVLRNYQHSYATFRFQTFTWTNVSDVNQAVYVHCDVTVCQNVNGECVDPGCGRKRRSVDPDHYRRLSFGPVRILETDHCDVNNGMCSDVCEMVDGRAECSCYEGRKITDGGRMCEVIDDGILDDTISDILCLLLIGSIFLTMATILYLGRRKTEVYNVL